MSLKGFISIYDEVELILSERRNELNISNKFAEDSNKFYRMIEIYYHRLW